MMARELVELQPEVIVTATASSVIALMRATQSIPIVFVAVGDPLGTGIVSNLARPGGNVTGFAATAPKASKLLELLKEISPTVSRASLMFNPDTSTYRQGGGPADFLGAAHLLGIEPIVAEVRNQAEIEAAKSALASERRGGLVVGQDNFNFLNRALIISLSRNTECQPCTR
jgi:putative ABC transport system substrate-binding protein